MVNDYDAIIIGGGAGLKIARPAADLGSKIAVVERSHLGGTCLNRGCIPSKMLIHPADIIEQINHLSQLDIKLEGKLLPDFKKIVQYVSKTIDEESQSIEPLLTKHKNIDFYHKNAVFIDEMILDVGGEKIRGKKIFIAVGTRPDIPNIEGLKETPYFTSTEVLRLEEKPKKIIIIGAGYIACELGHYLKAMGVDVHFIVRSKFLRLMDETIQKHFAEHFPKRFTVSYGTPHKVTHIDKTFYVSLNDEVIEADSLLIATGVTPNTDTLNLEKSKVKLDDRGYIVVNERLETTQKNIFAYGDIIGRWLFRHTANFEGEYLLRTQFQNPSIEPLVYPPIPYAVFTLPQIGGVGKTEWELKEEKREYIVGQNPYPSSAMGMALRDTVGLVKLLFDKATLKLIGGHIIGVEASNMVHMLIAYMKMGATLGDLLSTIYVHPALPENIRNAARDAKSKCRMKKC